MADMQQEREYLAQADQHIAESEKRLANQIRVIEGMIQNGHNTLGNRGASRPQARGHCMEERVVVPR
jgi:hypothetical protein